MTSLGSVSRSSLNSATTCDDRVRVDTGRGRSGALPQSKQGLAPRPLVASVAAVHAARPPPPQRHHTSVRAQHGLVAAALAGRAGRALGARAAGAAPRGPAPAGCAWAHARPARARRTGGARACARPAAHPTSRPRPRPNLRTRTQLSAMPAAHALHPMPHASVESIYSTHTRELPLPSRLQVTCGWCGGGRQCKSCLEMGQLQRQVWAIARMRTGLRAGDPVRRLRGAAAGRAVQQRARLCCRRRAGRRRAALRRAAVRRALAATLSRITRALAAGLPALTLPGEQRAPGRQRGAQRAAAGGRLRLLGLRAGRPLGLGRLPHPRTRGRGALRRDRRERRGRHGCLVGLVCLALRLSAARARRPSRLRRCRAPARRGLGDLAGRLARLLQGEQDTASNAAPRSRDACIDPAALHSLLRAAWPDPIKLPSLPDCVRWHCTNTGPVPAPAQHTSPHGAERCYVAAQHRNTSETAPKSPPLCARGRAHRLPLGRRRRRQRRALRRGRRAGAGARGAVRGGPAGRGAPRWRQRLARAEGVHKARQVGRRGRGAARLRQLREREPNVDQACQQLAQDLLLCAAARSAARIHTQFVTARAGGPLRVPRTDSAARGKRPAGRRAQQAGEQGQAAARRGGRARGGGGGGGDGGAGAGAGAGGAPRARGPARPAGAAPGCTPPARPSPARPPPPPPRGWRRPRPPTRPRTPPHHAGPGSAPAPQGHLASGWHSA